MSQVIFEKQKDALIGRLSLPDGSVISIGVHLPLRDSITEEEAKHALLNEIEKRQRSRNPDQSTHLT